MTATLDRRALLALGLVGLVPGVALAGAPTNRRLSFTVLRNGTRVGEHVMTFAGDLASPTVTTDVRMSVRVGPVPVFRYRHHAVERWVGGQFSSLETNSDSNGKAERVSARRTDAGVVIQTPKQKITAAIGTKPFTHWNSEVLDGPLFNPQTGKLLKVAVRQVSPRHWAVRGDAEIDNWYDEAGVWNALKGRLSDGSLLEYRRI